MYIILDLKVGQWFKRFHVGTPKQSTNVTRYKLKRPLLIRFKIEGHPLQFFDLPNALLLRGEEGEWDPALASKEDRDVALPFSDLGLCLGSCTCNPATQEKSYSSPLCAHNFYIFGSEHKNCLTL